MVQLRANIRRSIKFYNAQVDAFHNTNPTGNKSERTQEARNFVTDDDTRFHWIRKQYNHAAEGRRYKFYAGSIRIALYRPFFKQRLYFDHNLVEAVRKFPEIYPGPDTENFGISITGLGSIAPFYTLMTDMIADSGFTSPSKYFPRYRYEKFIEFGTEKIERVSNINPKALAEFRQHYRDNDISENDLFYYTYGVLHSQQWRETFANDLAKSAARIPMASSLADFRAFVDAGWELSKLHVNYESVKPYPLDEVHSASWQPNAPNAYRVEKMKYAGKGRKRDKSTIVYNAHITLRDIPEQAHDYVLGTRSALDWLIDRYQIRTHKKSGIVNDPNDWAAEVGEPRYILDLIKRVTTVSLETVALVRALPELPI